MEISLPQFHMQASVFNPISDFSLFSVSHFLINQNFTLNLSLRSLYSQSQVSLVLSLNPSLHTLHNPHSFPNPSCCRHRLITTLTALSHFQPWVKPSHAHGSASQSQDSRVYFLHFSSIFFSILRYGFFILFNLLKT